MKWIYSLTFLCSTIFIFLAVFTVTIYAQNSNDVIVTITNTEFSPAVLQVNTGTTVVFINKDTVPHWPASNIHPTHEIYAAFDPKEPIAPGESWNFRFNRTGIWKYHDHLFPNMTGTIQVSGAPTPINKSTSSSLTDLLASVKTQTTIIFYTLFPTRLTQKLTTINLPTVIKNEKELHFWLAILGSDKTMEKLLADTGGGTLIDCHQEAHTIGRLAFAMEGQEVFQKGSFACHSGFYHGAMEAFLQKNGTDNLGKKISTLCNLFTTQFGNFECLHGVGHGVLAYEDYNLPRAITLCGELDTSFAQSSCYGGIFMENIITAEGRGASPTHTTLWVNDDPHFPCNTLSQGTYSAREQCYLMQTSRMLDIFHHDFTKVIPECSNAPDDMKDTCFQSIGRDIAGQTLRNPTKILSLCDQVPSNYWFTCVRGALYVIIDFWGDGITNQPHELCNILHELDQKKQCYTLLGSRLIEIFTQQEERRDRCNYAPVPLQETCIHAAQAN